MESLLKSQAELRDLASFARGAWPVLEPGTELKWNWHLDLIAEYLTLVQQRVIRRLIINVPPQTMKSRFVNVFYPTWSWSQIPTRRFLSSSYSGDLSEGFNVERSKLVRSEWFQQMFPAKVSLSQDTQAQIENEVGGRMTATSTGGTATGKGAHDVIIDDPLNPKLAASEVELAASNNFFDDTLRTRLSDQATGVFVIVMQRLDYQDLTGHVLAKNPGEWTHIKIPMVAEEEERWTFPISGRVVVRQPGDLLWQDRFPESVVASLKTDMGTRSYEGQYQQRPSPKGGNIIKENWIKYWRVMPQSFDQVIQSWDMSFADTKTSSFVVGQVWGRLGARKLLLAEVHKRMDFVETVREVRQMSGNWPQAHAKLVENKANGPAVISALKLEVDGLIAVEPDGDKAARMYAVSPDYEAGNVEVPDPTMPGYGWVEEHVAEIIRFPGKPNDRGDAVSQALKRLRSFPSGIASFYQEIAEPKVQGAAA
jgi:predicted phage terminase large subunit-like protein